MAMPERADHVQHDWMDGGPVVVCTRCGERLALKTVPLRIRDQLVALFRRQHAACATSKGGRRGA